MTVNRWHANSDPRLRDAGDTIDEHQRRVTTLCLSLADHMGHPLFGSDLPFAAANHDEAERILGDMPAPAKARFPALAAAYETAERVVLAEMGLTWTITAKEQQMLHLCDRLDAYQFAMSRGVTGQEWDEARTMLHVMSDKFKAQEWVAAQMEAGLQLNS
jgi:5'-deoxynucleotidase YfbR-like HD superfamily hydrolase